jgi:hypothetical protein
VVSFTGHRFFIAAMTATLKKKNNLLHQGVSHSENFHPVARVRYVVCQPDPGGMQQQPSRLIQPGCSGHRVTARVISGRSGQFYNEKLSGLWRPFFAGSATGLVP